MSGEPSQGDLLGLSRRQLVMMDRAERTRARAALLQMELDLHKVHREALRGVAAARKLLTIINDIERRAAHEHPVSE